MPPARGEIWYAELGPVRGHEQDGVRPVLVLSARERVAFAVSLVIPITSRFRDVPSHIPIYPPEGGLRVPSYLLCEHLRAISHSRLGRRLGAVGEETLDAVSFVLHRLMLLRCPPSADRVPRSRRRIRG